MIKLTAGAGARIDTRIASSRPSCSTGRDSKRRIDVDLAPGASLLMAGTVMFGRSAMGEAMEEGAFTVAGVRLDGRLVFAETVLLDGAIARRLASRR